MAQDYWKNERPVRQSLEHAKGRTSNRGEIMEVRQDLLQAFERVQADVHALEEFISQAFGLPSPQVLGTGEVGVGPEIAARDHVHPMGSGRPLTVRGPDNSEGMAVHPARYDHQHRLEVEVLLGGVFKGRRPSLNFLGSVDISDNSLADRMDVNVTGGGPGSAGAIQNFFDSSDHPGPVSVGTVPAGRTIEKVVLEVLAPFNVGQVTVGDDAAQARLMAASDSRLSLLADFRVESGYLCGSDTEIKVFFSGPAPTVGIGRVIVYFA